MSKSEGVLVSSSNCSNGVSVEISGSAQIQLLVEELFVGFESFSEGVDVSVVGCEGEPRGGGSNRGDFTSERGSDGLWSELFVSSSPVSDVGI